MDSTTNSRVYKLARKLYLENTGGIIVLIIGTKML